MHLAGVAGEAASRATEESTLSTRSIGTVLSDGRTGVVDVPETLEGLGSKRADVAATSNIIVVRGIPGAQFLPATSLEGSANKVSVVDIDGKSRLVVGATRLSSSRDTTGTHGVPLVQQKLLRKSAESRVHGDVATVATASAAKSRCSGRLEERNTSSGSRESSARVGGDAAEETRSQAVGGLNELTGEL